MPTIRREPPPWFRLIERFVPLAPTTHIYEVKTQGGRVYGYCIGGLGWSDGGRDRRVHATRLGAAVATWEWWMTTEACL